MGIIDIGKTETASERLTEKEGGRGGRERKSEREKMNGGGRKTEKETENERRIDTDRGGRI